MPGFKKISHCPTLSTINEWETAGSHESLPDMVQPIEPTALNEDRRLGEDPARTTQTARTLSERSRLFPGSAVERGMDVRAKAAQLTIVGDEITDPNHPAFGKHPIDTTRSAGWVIGADVPTSLSALLGVGACFFFSKNRDVRFRTHLTQEETGALVAMENGKGTGKKVAWATLKDAPIPVPNLSCPDTLKPGDRVQVETLGTVEAGAYGSAVYLFQAGARFTVTGEFGLTVEKISDHHVEVECVPTRVFGAKIFVSGWVFGSAYISEAIAQQIGQKFRFDLSTEAGRGAYQNVLQGKMPGQLTSSQLDPTQHNLEKLQSEFPTGIKRLMVTRTTCRQRNAGGKAGFSLPQVGASYSLTRTASVTSDGDTSVNQKIYARATEYSTPLRGSKENGITGCLQSTTVKVGPDDYATHFDGYKATAFFSGTVVRGDQYSTSMLQRLNQDLDAGLTLPGAESPRSVRDAPCNRRGRRVEASVEFTPEDIVAIGETDPSEVDAIATRHGVSASAIGNLVRAVGEAATPVDAAERLGDFLGDHGRPGLGVLVKLARMTPKDIVIRTESGSYQGVLTDSVNYLRKHGSPLSAEAKKNDLTCRLQEGEKLRNDLKLGLKLLADDPVLDLPYNQVERDRLISDLEGKLEAIERAMGYGHLTPEEGFVLWSSLGRGWTTGAQARAQEQILHASGLTLERNERNRAHATASQEETHRRKGVSLQSATRRLPLFGDPRTLISVGVARDLNEDASSPPRTFTVEARVSDENLRWQGMNRRFIQRINQAYGLEFKRSEVRARGEQTLVLRQTFSESDLNRIALVPPQEVVEALKEAGVPGDEAYAAGWTISTAASREDLVAVLTRFVQERGIVAAGALARISSQFDSPVTLQLDSLSGAISSDLESVRKLLNRFDTPVDSGLHSEVILRRIEEVESALVTLQNLKTRMLDYPFFNDVERIRQLRIVDVLEESLENTLDLTGLSHDALANLYHDTKKYRWSAVRDAVMSRLKTNAGLRRISANPTGGTRYSEVLRKFNDGSSVLESCVSRDGECDTMSFIRARLDERNELAGVEVEVSLHELKTSKTQLKKNFIDPLDRHLGYGAGSIARYPRDPHQRRVLVRMRLSENEVQTISTLSPELIEAAANSAAVSSTGVESLAAQLNQASTGPDKAQVVGHFLAHAGLEGVGAIKSLLEISNDRISVTTVNGLLETLRGEVNETLLSYEGTAATDSTTNNDLKARFAEISRAEKSVALMRRMASADPFVDNTVLEASLKELDALARRVRVTQEGTTPPRYQAVVV